MNTTNTAISARIQATTPRSAWSRGVKLYALELLESLESDYTADALLNGADNWQAFSSAGALLFMTPTLRNVSPLLPSSSARRAAHFPRMQVKHGLIVRPAP